MALTSVEISSVRKSFGPTMALGGASLVAYAGEVHAIVGGNGSGKSTMAKVMSGVLIPDSGQVSIYGHSATTPAEARALGIANVFQEVLVADECSVLDNLYLGADGLFSSSLSRDEKVARAARLMHELLGFDIDLDDAVGNLPLSLKQWITIARALLTDPKILILDESSAALDFDSTERLFRKLRQLKARGASILIVTHRIAELVRIADRATVLREGVDVGRLAREEITEQRILDLIAGPERQRAQAGQVVPERLGQSPLMRIEGAKIWPDAAAINLSLYPGDILGITGLDGQGQADFVRCVAGVQELEAGRITVFSEGRPHVIDGLQAARNNNISYVSGDRKKEGIFANLSIFENLLMPVYREYRAGGVLNLINTTKLDPVFAWESSKLAIKMGSRDNRITSLSGGNQQKVLIARAFAEKPVVLVLNDPARGIDIGAKLDLYRNLRDFAARGNAVLFLSSEIEEFLNLCTRVQVFRNGAVAFSFEPPFDGHVLLNAMFGRRLAAALGDEPAHDPGEAAPAAATTHGWASMATEDGRPVPRPVPTGFSGALPAAAVASLAPRAVTAPFQLAAAEIGPGDWIPRRFCEDSRISPRLVWSGTPEGTRCFALSITDPDLPAEFNFPRAFAHWLVLNIPAQCRDLPEGASQSTLMPAGSLELNSDFVTFGIAGFAAGYGGPWPPDRAHRYVFTLYALKTERIDLPVTADLAAFSAAVLPATIGLASFVALYGPATQPLPTPDARP